MPNVNSHQSEVAASMCIHPDAVENGVTVSVSASDSAKNVLAQHLAGTIPSVTLPLHVLAMLWTEDMG